MLKLSLLLAFILSSLSFTACNSDTIVNAITKTNDSEKETIAKKDVVYIIKHTPESICTSDSFKQAIEITMEEVIQQSNTKIINIKDIITSTQTNDVTCDTFKPLDITDLVDPLCEEMKAIEINEAFTIPTGIELNDLIATSCVVAGDIF